MRASLRRLSARFQVVAGGEEVVRAGKLRPLPEVPSRLFDEDFTERFHENPDCNDNRDWSAEVRGFYRDLIKSITYQKYFYRMGVPETVVRKNIRRLFEEGPKLTDPAALRLKVLKASSEMEEYFQGYMQDNHVVSRFNSIDPHPTMRKDIERSSGPTQAAYRFFNEGKNVFTEQAIGQEDVTENRVYIAREEAYKKGIAAMSASDLVHHFAPGLDKPNRATLQTIPSLYNIEGLLKAAASTADSFPQNTAEDYVTRCASFLNKAKLQHNKPVGPAVKLAWERYSREPSNAVVLLSPAYRALASDPARNALLRGPADCVRLGLSPARAEPELLSKVAAHLYYSDQLPDSWSEDLNISYLADLKGIDRRLDLLLDEEIAFREEELLRVRVATVEAIKATCGSPEDPDQLSSHLQSFNWETFTISQPKSSTKIDPVLQLK